MELNQVNIKKKKDETKTLGILTSDGRKLGVQREGLQTLQTIFKSS